MESKKGRIVKAENAAHMHIYGSASEPVTSYKKCDFLTPTKVAKKFGIAPEEALAIMQKLMRQGVVFGLNGNKKNVVQKSLKGGTLHLHPMAIEVFQEYLNKKAK